MSKGWIEFSVSRPPEVVWEFLLDLERAPEWIPDLESLTQLDPGEVAVGTRYAQVARMAGRRTESELVVTELDPPRVLAHEGSGPGVRFAARFSLAPMEGGTLVRHDYELLLSGPLAMLEPLVERWMRKNASAGVDGLERALARRA